MLIHLQYWEASTWICYDGKLEDVLVVVDECDGISRSELQHRIVENRPQVIARPHLAGSMEVVM